MGLLPKFNPACDTPVRAKDVWPDLKCSEHATVAWQPDEYSFTSVPPTRCACPM